MIMYKSKSLDVLESFSLNNLGVTTSGGSSQLEGK